ncbi:hypothetical protein JYK17_09170 [Streptomyces sp. KC 17012]|nr:hypothetical protein [Streptomyces plumbidurans]
MSSQPAPDLAAPTPDRLLMPPFFTMNWAWQTGYFRTVAHDILSERVKPCGWFALINFEHFQRELDEALAGRPVHGAYARNADGGPGVS